jgi:CubicO group peptidase (beta-lactamase class C family)
MFRRPSRPARSFSRIFSLTLLLGWGCLLLVGCGNLATTDLDSDGLTAARNASAGDLQSDADALVRPLVDEGLTPGAVAGVLLPNGSMRFFGYGTTGGESGSRPDGDTLFAVGSLSKGFLGATAGLLVDKGIVSWDDRLETLLPPGTRLSADAKQVTLLQLATHTSGMPRQPIDKKTLAFFVRYLFTGESFYQHFDDDYLLDYLSTFEADDRGEPQYSNIGYGTLGYALSRRSGMQAEALVDQQVIQPLGLRCTGYVPEVLPCFANRAHGYAGDQPKFIRRGDPTPDWEFTDVIRASAGLHSTARDLLTFAAAHLRGADTRFDAVLADNTRVRVPRAHRAADIAWVTDTIGGRQITYQVGFVAGYVSYLGLDIANRTAVVLLQNSFNWDVRAGHLMLLRMAYRAAAGQAMTSR